VNRTWAITIAALMSFQPGVLLAGDLKCAMSARRTVTGTDVWKSAPGPSRRPVLAAVMAVSALLVTSSPAAAQAHVGIRGGTSVAPANRIPDVTAQLYVGAHVETEPLVGRLVFRPNVEIGFGDDLVVLAINGEFVWRFPASRSGWLGYAGAGPAMSIFRFGTDRPDHGDAKMVPGISFLGGFEYRAGVFFEFKLGVLNRPDIARPLLAAVEELKVGIGYTWR
jgi:hypothetical protein